MSWLLESCLLVFVLALAGGVVPFLLRRTERVQHLMIALAAGVFLGATFLHLLPEVATLADQQAHRGEAALEAAGAAAENAEMGHVHQPMTLWLVVLAGVVTLFLVENLFFRRRRAALPEGASEDATGQTQHQTVGYVAFFGLSVHAFTTGLGLSAGADVPELQAPLLFSVVSHKAVEGFSLAAAFLLARMPRGRILLYLLLFAMVTPAGALLRLGLAPDMGVTGLALLTAFAAGTFLFVALCDLLPEVFHHATDTGLKVALLATGIGVSLLLGAEGPATALFGFVRELAFITCETAPYLLAGFFIAGLMKVFIPPRLILGKLGGNDLASVTRASLYGVPVPLCSCSVLPTATSLRESGASKGATASFLISTPETGVDSISVTWALLDPLMTVVRPVVAFITALVTGSFVNVLVRRGWDGAGTAAASAEEPRAAADEVCADDVCAEDVCEDAGLHASPDPAAPPLPLGERLREAVRYAFGPLLDDLTPWLIIGFVLSAIIAVVIPEDLFTETIPPGLPSMLLMAVVATPVYICATASTPIAASLIAKGLDPGAALVFLLLGPATNATTLLVVTRLLGRRTLLVYLAGITLVALAAGLVVNAIYARTDLDLAGVVAETLEHGPGVVGILGGLVLAGLLAGSVRRLRAARGAPV